MSSFETQCFSPRILGQVSAQLRIFWHFEKLQKVSTCFVPGQIIMEKPPPIQTKGFSL